MSFASVAPVPFFATSALPGQPAEPFMNPRLMPVVVAVVCAHGLALWALQTGFSRPKPEAEPPTIMVATLIDPPQPEAAPSPDPLAVPLAKPLVQPVRRREVLPTPKPLPKPAPAPSKAAEQAPLPEPTNAATNEAPASASAEPAVIESSPAPPAAAPAVALAPPAPPKVELPSSSASYLNNPKAPYPPLSKRLGEQGKVVVRVQIGSDGTASQASIHASSGYQRLDQTARETVLKWRFVPGTRGGVPEAMWFNVPISFELE